MIHVLALFLPCMLADMSFDNSSVFAISPGDHYVLPLTLAYDVTRDQEENPETVHLFRMQKLEVDKAYEASVSFLGSPPVSFHLSVIFVDRNEQMNAARGTSKTGRKLMDREFIRFSTHFDHDNSDLPLKPLVYYSEYKAKQAIVGFSQLADRLADSPRGSGLLKRYEPIMILRAKTYGRPTNTERKRYASRVNKTIIYAVMLQELTIFGILSFQQLSPITLLLPALLLIILFIRRLAAAERHKAKKTKLI